jgi:hypothetical protein
MDDFCYMPTNNGYWAAPEGATRRLDLAPRITRTGGSSAPWQLTCEGCDLWGGPWKRKGDAVKALAEATPRALRNWYANAYASLERAGRSLCVAREVAAPESACTTWDAVPCHNEPDFDGVVRGLYYCTGMPICPY